MKRSFPYILALVLPFLGGPAFAQQIGGAGAGVQVSGTPTTGNCAKWSNSSTLTDAGSPCGSGGGSTIVKCALAPASDTITSSGMFAASCPVNANVLASASLIEVQFTFAGTNNSGSNWFVTPEVETAGAVVLMNPGNVGTAIASTQTKQQVLRGYLVMTGSGASAPFTASALLDFGGNAPAQAETTGTLNTTAAQTIKFAVTNIPASSSAQLINAMVLVFP